MLCAMRMAGKRPVGRRTILKWALSKHDARTWLHTETSEPSGSIDGGEFEQLDYFSTDTSGVTS